MGPELKAESPAVAVLPTFCTDLRGKVLIEGAGHWNQQEKPEATNAALLAFLDAEYHARPHSSLMGESPSKRFHRGLGALPRAWTAKELAAALEISTKRRVAGDATFSVDGRTFEVRGRHLAHKTIDVVVDP